MINEFRQRVLKRVPKGKVLLATERYSPLHILERIEKHKDIFVIKLYSHWLNKKQSYNMDAGFSCWLFRL
jgi:hypothetical protein